MSHCFIYSFELKSNLIIFLFLEQPTRRFLVFSYRKVMFSISMGRCSKCCTCSKCESFGDCSKTCSECARCCESSRRSEFTFASIIIVADVVSVADVTMIEDVGISIFITNVLSVPDVSIPVKVVESNHSRAGYKNFVLWGR